MRDVLFRRVMDALAPYAPNVESAIQQAQIITPLDLENAYGLHEGHLYHGELMLDQFLFMRPVPGYAQYRSPLPGLYLCGAGAHPGGGVNGVSGYNAAREIIRDIRRNQ
jgi:phytoene dehydrogenase-like protein